MTYQKSKGVEIAFTDYETAFEGYYEHYKNLCLSIIADKNLISNIKEISLFFREYDYSIYNLSRRENYHNSLRKLKDEIEKNEVLKTMNSNKDKGFSKRTDNLKLYFEYLIKALEILSEYVGELTSSFMPRTNLQKKSIKWANNRIFYRKFAEVKKIVNEHLANFELTKFPECYKAFLVYSFAYKLYLNDGACRNTHKLLSITLSYYSHKDYVSMFNKYPALGSTDKKRYRALEDTILDSISLANSIINQSFSDYGILPKRNDKVFIDVTGI